MITLDFWSDGLVLKFLHVIPSSRADVYSLFCGFSWAALNLTVALSYTFRLFLEAVCLCMQLYT